MYQTNTIQCIGSAYSSALRGEIPQANSHPPQPKARISFTSTTQRSGPNANILTGRKQFERIEPYYKQKQERKTYIEIKGQK
jgi:hypothetical protein